MDKAKDPGLFVNDGSFMERFKQLQQEKEKKVELLEKPRSGPSSFVSSSPKTVISKTTINFRPNGSQKTVQAPSNGKFAFSLKQKSKLVAPPIKFGEDEDEDEGDAGNSPGRESVKRPKLAQLDASDQSSRLADVAPPSPSDPTVRNVADKLASFVAKNGRQFEHVTRQKNPGDTPFKFLFDESCSDYKYYEYRLNEEQKALSQTRDSQVSQSGQCIDSEVSLETLKFFEQRSITTPNSAAGYQRPHHQQLKYQTPASALYEATENIGSSHASSQTTGRHGTSRKPLSPNPNWLCQLVIGESSATTGSDPIAMMEYYMKKAAEEEKLRPPKPSKDEMPPPASLQAPMKKGHHMGDYIPPEELEKFLATCNDVSAQKVAQEAADKAKIQADNVGHRLLSKMGWKEGEGLGSSRSGIATPIMAGDVKKDNLGVGAHAPGEVTAEDDIYEQYKKRMMLGYRHRPNPLVKDQVNRVCKHQP
ncbi:UNVERIFIED_CONTAM: SURP and G-patch domain-containing protein 1-like protein [Sesamum indicum]